MQSGNNHLSNFYDINVGTFHVTQPENFEGYKNQIEHVSGSLLTKQKTIQKLKKTIVDSGAVLRPSRINIDKNVDKQKQFVISRVFQFLDYLEDFVTMPEDLSLVFTKAIVRQNPIVCAYLKKKFHLQFVKEMNTQMRNLYRESERVASLVMDGVLNQRSNRDWTSFTHSVM